MSFLSLRSSSSISSFGGTSSGADKERSVARLYAWASCNNQIQIGSLLETKFAKHVLVNFFDEFQYSQTVWHTLTEKNVWDWEFLKMETRKL